jgi:mannose-1-phosphate guanylyltransferase/phosphomannomutase
VVVRRASASATTLRKGRVSTRPRHGSRAARALERAAIAALNASAINVRELQVVAAPIARFDARSGDADGGILLRTTPGDPQSIDIAFLDANGADLSRAAQRKLERVFSRQEFRRAFPGEIAELTYPARVSEIYSHDLLRAIDTSGVPDDGLKVVLDTAGGAASLVLPTLLGRLGVDVLTVNGRLDETSTAETLAQHMRDIERLGDLVSSSRAAFGVRFDSVGERIAIVDERGQLVPDDRALLVFLDLVAAENRGASAAVPVTTTSVAEQVGWFHGMHIARTSTSPDELARAARRTGVRFAADGRGGFLVPEFAPALDGIAAFVRLLGLVARTKLTLSQIDARIPQAHVLRRSVPTPWADTGAVMRRAVEAAAGRAVDTTDGVRIEEGDGRWVLVLPDPAEPVTHVWAEGRDAADTTALLEGWAVVLGADRG